MHYSGLNEHKKLLLRSFTQLFGRKTLSQQPQNLNLPNVFKNSAPRKIVLLYENNMRLGFPEQKPCALETTQICMNVVLLQNELH